MEAVKVQNNDTLLQHTDVPASHMDGNVLKTGAFGTLSSCL
jgi:hypothetical protein